MGAKRSLVAAILNATAASDIFTQDIEDMEPETLNGHSDTCGNDGHSGQTNGQGDQKKNQQGTFWTYIKQESELKGFEAAHRSEIMGWPADQKKRWIEHWHKVTGGDYKEFLRSTRSEYNRKPGSEAHIQ
jgi:hypothetical protein